MEKYIKNILTVLEKIGLSADRFYVISIYDGRIELQGKYSSEIAIKIKGLQVGENGYLTGAYNCVIGEGDEAITIPYIITLTD